MNNRIIFSIKIFFLLLIVAGATFYKNQNFISQIHDAYRYDTFNIFHWKSIRFTAAEPNKNYVKTRYVISNPKRFNAFVFGSSRVANIPPTCLPKELNGINLNWYNMTMSCGVPSEHYLTLQTFLKNAVDIQMVLVGFDNMSMYESLDAHKTQLLRMQYQMYEEKKSKFFIPYLQMKTDGSIREEIESYDPDLHVSDKDFFYTYGTSPSVTSFDFTETPVLERYEIAHFGYQLRDSYKDIENIVGLCREYGIRLVLFTSPMYKILYRNGVEDGYFDFLKKVARHCEFYNFSTLNNFTQNPKYFYEWSHYRPVLGLLVEKILFGTEEERKEARRQSGDGLWGIKVNASNIDMVIEELKKQLE